MAVDIQKYVEQIVEKLTGDKGLLAGFQKNPIESVKSLLGNVDLDDGVIKSIIDAVKGKINLDDAAGKAKGILGFFKKLFGK